MGTLILFNLILILIVSAALFGVKKCARSEKAEYLLFLIAPIITILCHYSGILFRDGDLYAYLEYNVNLVLPIYPCNVVMWCCLIYGIMRNKRTKFALFLSDYIFWFGIASTLVGMFANVDFIENPTLRNYEVTKSIIAHATLLFNVLLIPVFSRLRPEFKRNMISISLSVVMMYVIGLYCNLLLRVLVSAEKAYYKNSMFIIHSPFEGLPFLRYPVIALAALIIYLVIFTVVDLIKNPKGERWFEKATRKFIKK